MNNNKFIPILLTSMFILAGCGTATEEQVQTNSEPVVEKQEPKREIIAELKQTVTETPKRDQMVKEVNEQFSDGSYGKVTPEFLENMEVQSIEGNIANAAVDLVYGAYPEFNDDGVIFYGPEEEPGFWIGIKKPDERIDELVRILQEKVDNGEILAKYIHIFKNNFSLKDQNDLMGRAGAEVKKMAQEFHNPTAISYSVSVDTLTGEIQIGHNFLTEEQIEQLKGLFAEHKVVFTQDGPMAPKEGEPDVTYPDEEFTKEPQTDGSFVVSVSDNQFLAAWTRYDFKDAGKKLKVGQRVIVTASGPIMESLPAQGSASYVKVLSDYKPENAVLSESEAVIKAIEEARKKSNFAPNISKTEYDPSAGLWTVYVSQEDEYEIQIKDQ